MSKHHSKITRQVPVTNKKTGETQLRDAPEKKQNSAITNELQTTATEVVISDVKHESGADSEMTISKKVKADEKNTQETLEQFIEDFYSGKTKSLSSDRVRKIKKLNFEIDLREQLVISAAKSDLTLEKSKNLLTLLTELGTYQTFQHSVSEFIRDTVMRHPIMASHGAHIWLPLSGGHDEANLNELFEAIGAVKKSASNNKDKGVRLAESEKKTATELQKARLNAFYIAVIWRYSKNYLGFTDIARVLRSTVYKLQVDKSVIESYVLDALVTAQGKEITSIASLMQWYFDQGEYDRNLVEMARRKAEVLSEQLDEKKGLLTSAHSQIEGLNEEIEGLRKQLDAAHEKERVQVIHTRADQQKQKGRTLRILEEEIPMLADCLTALERDPPKVAVAKEYMGTVLQKLSNELAELKGDE